MPYKTYAEDITTEEQARKNIASFYEDIDMPGGYKFNHVETLRMIDLYYNSKYKTGDKDALGLKKFFYNVVKPACDIATKFIDLDTKDIILNPEHANDEFRVWVMQRKLKQYLKDNGFASLLNDLAFNLPKYGRDVVKKDKTGKWCRVNIQNLRFNTSVKKLADSEFVYELLKMSRTDIKKMGWDEEQVTELFDRGYDQTFLIYECYDKTVDGWKRTIRADLYSTKRGEGINRAVESELSERDDYYGALILLEDTVYELPYRDDLIWEQVPGRWLGLGFVEYLEEDQIATNEAENLERKGLAVSSLQLLQTRDENVGGQNVLANAQNGDIIKVDSEITKVDLAERNLAAYNNTRNNWKASVERKTFTTDITTGANLPSRTPLGVANLQVSLATSYFDLKRENFGIFIKNLVMNDIIPDFEKDTNPEHILTFLGSDEEIERLDGIITQRYMDDAVLDYALKTGYFPSQVERERVKAEIQSDLRRNKNRYLKIGEGWYRNAKYIVDVNVTGESIDNGARNQVLQLALQILGTNPAILQNPVTKKIFFAILSMGGISPIDLGMTEVPQVQPGMMEQMGAMAPGGSVSVPQSTPQLQASSATY